jgi:hypothetical protein
MMEILNHSLLHLFLLSPNQVPVTHHLSFHSDCSPFPFLYSFSYHYLYMFRILAASIHSFHCLTLHTQCWICWSKALITSINILLYWISTITTTLLLDTITTITTIAFAILELVLWILLPSMTFLLNILLPLPLYRMSTLTLLINEFSHEQSS